MSSDGAWAALTPILRRSAVVGIAEDARVALLSRLIDHAPLFPPASLPLSEALAEDRRAQASASSFMLGRLVWPASRLGELLDVRRGLSIVLDAPFEVDPRVEAVEVLLADDLEAHERPASEVYVEVPLDDELDGRLEALQAAGLRAKVRCGGAAVPTSAELARFVRACHERGLAFKATAGLHHALRRDREHGFLNLLAAIVFGDEEAALEETDVEAFRLDSGSFAWRGREAGPDVLRRRRELLWSIGSCSFFEPLAELEALGMLPA
jgi:hypothetical protein